MLAATVHVGNDRLRIGNLLRRDGGYPQVLRLAKNFSFLAHAHNVLWINLYNK